jgi:ABC-type transport system involved in cytochrome bd biosynthesis fused ATPase/permease subunit
VVRVFGYSLANQQLADNDKRYLGQLVARHTGLSQADAEKRVADTFAAYQRNLEQAATKAKEAADAARKAAAYASLWMFLALLCGAFVASLLATYGGRLRDRNELYGEPVLHHELHAHRVAEPELR